MQLKSPSVLHLTESSKMKFEFTLEQVNLILHALSKLPYEMSADMIGEVRKQAEPQVIAAQQKASSAEPVDTE